jgi:hypothetical protein
MSDKPISDLRRRMIADMTVRSFGEKTQHDSPRLAPLKAILGKLDPPKPQPAMPPPLKGRMAPSASRRRRSE